MYSKPKRRGILQKPGYQYRRAEDSGSKVGTVDWKAGN